MAKKPNTIDAIAAARTWLDLTENVPELLDAKDLPQKIKEVRYAFRQLLDFRNIVCMMSSLRDEPKQAAREFLRE